MPFCGWRGARCIQGADCLGVDHAGPVYRFGFCHRCWGSLSHAERATLVWEHGHTDELEAAWLLPPAPDGPRDAG